ncbi:cation:proton antiporter [Allomesorhizobium camelthorni]|uniref:Cyclic nucleotide-binding domain-containing protein n=1 Tax=Allomesorhizobium camelthorni TaxID=475069 RepID=A0A6G4W7C8_9HYPH|nr:cation:proton antiporter [Mesorhizobium camelthorni]NGO50661.1 cyclic nucleotide-binding domain-containing protein [Mesorhizobium camelthorni]
MPHDVNLVATIAVGFVLASIFGYLADRLRLPALVGYLVAGIFIGPFTPGFVADADMAGQLAEIGIVLLMFGVGLHFSASDLLAVRGVVVAGALGQILLATLLGFGLCWLWGWNAGHGIVFGLCISVASTVVLLKALEERNLLQSTQGRVAVGWLIVEDLAMVLALVLLPVFAESMGGHAEAGSETSSAPITLTILLTLTKVAGFALIAALIGPRIVPWILIKVARTGSRELFTLSVLALALGIAFGSAAAFGVSFALGAFFAGVIMGESQLSHRAAANSLPLQDAFSVLFFVSIGMLFEPAILVEKPLEVLAVVAVIALGKPIGAFLLILALRYPVRLALGIAAGIAQIGEFSFILAGLGAAYGLVTKEGQSLILAAALLAITINPLAFATAEALERWISGRFPRWSANFGRRRERVLAVELDRIQAQAKKRDHEQARKITEFIETFPLFKAINVDDQEELLLLFVPKAASPGDRIVRIREKGDAMYFVVSGTVEVDVNGAAVQLGAGSFFGEMALLTGDPRTADVTAVDYCNFLVLSRRDFRLFMSRHPAVRAAVQAMAEERLAMNRAAVNSSEYHDERLDQGAAATDR